MAVDETLLVRLDELLEKGNRVLSSGEEMMYSDNTFVDKDLFSEWRVGSEAFILRLLGEGHVYYQRFSEVSEPYGDATLKGLGILRALKEELEGGYLTTVRSLVAAEVFTDFLDMADHLLDAGFKDPAASLTGAVLEDGLRRICREKNITVKSKDDLDSLNHRLADAQAYNRLTQKKLKVWTDVRNHADHGEFGEYTAEDVHAMLAGVHGFLADHLA
jgi:hypothetical protein